MNADLSATACCFWLFPNISNNSQPQPCGDLDCQGPVLVHALGPSTRGDGPPFSLPVAPSIHPAGVPGRLRGTPASPPPLGTSAARTRNARDQRGVSTASSLQPRFPHITRPCQVIHWTQLAPLVGRQGVRCCDLDFDFRSLSVRCL